MFFSVYYCIEESFENAISCILWLADAPVSEAAIAKGVKEGDVCFPKDFHMKITNQLVESNITAFCVTSGVLEPILTCFVTMLHRNHMACKMKDNHAAMIQDSDSLLCLEQLVKQGAGSTDVLMKKTLQLLEGNRLKLSFREDMHHECDAYMVLQYQFLLALHSKSASDMLKYAKALCDLMPDTHNSLIATVGDFEVLWHLHIQQYKDAGGSKVCVQDEEEADVLGNLMENITASMFDIGEEGTESNGTEGSSSGVHDDEDDDDVLTRSNATVTGVTSASTSSDSSSNSHNNNSSNSGCAASGGNISGGGNTFLQRMLVFPALWHFLYHTTILLFHMYGADILAPINSILVADGSEDLEKIRTWQHMHHLIAVASDSISRELLAIFEVTQKENLEEQETWEFDAALYEDWLKQAKAGSSRNERTISHYASFVRNAQVYLTMYFAGRRGNAVLFHECIAHFGGFYSLLGKPKYFKLFLYTMAQFRAMSEFQSDIFRLFFACALGRDFDRMLLNDESLESSLNMACKQVLKATSLIKVQDYLPFLQYTKPALEAVRKIIDKKEKKVRYDRLIARNTDICTIQLCGVLRVIWPQATDAIGSQQSTANAAAASALSASVDGANTACSTAAVSVSIENDLDMTVRVSNATDHDSITTLGGLNVPWKYFTHLLHPETLIETALKEGLVACQNQLSTTNFDSPVRLPMLASQRLHTFTDAVNDKKKMAKIMKAQKKRVFDAILKQVTGQYNKSLHSTVSLAEIEKMLRPLCFCYLNSSGDLNTSQKSKLVSVLVDKLQLNLSTDTERDRVSSIIVDLPMPLHGGQFFKGRTTTHGELNQNIVHWIIEIFGKYVNLKEFSLEYDVKAFTTPLKGFTQDKRITAEFLQADSSFCTSLMNTMFSSKKSWMNALQNRTYRDVIVFLFCEWLYNMYHADSDRAGAVTPSPLDFLRQGQKLRIAGVTTCIFGPDKSGAGDNFFIRRDDQNVYDYIFWVDSVGVKTSRIVTANCIGEGELRAGWRALQHFIDTPAADSTVEIWANDTDAIPLMMIANAAAPIRQQRLCDDIETAMFDRIFIRQKATQGNGDNQRLFTCSSIFSSVYKSEIWLQGMDNNSKLLLFVWLWMTSGIDFVYARSGFGFSTNMDIAGKMLSELVVDPRVLREMMMDITESSSSAAQPPQFSDNFAHIFTAFSYAIKRGRLTATKRYDLFTEDNGSLKMGEACLTEIRLLQIREHSEVKEHLCPSFDPNHRVNSAINYTLRYWWNALFSVDGKLPLQLPTGLRLSLGDVGAEVLQVSEIAATPTVDQRNSASTLELSTSIIRVKGVTEILKCSIKTCGADHQALCCSANCICHTCSLLCSCTGHTYFCKTNGATARDSGHDWTNSAFINNLKSNHGKVMASDRCNAIGISTVDAEGKSIGIGAMRELLINDIPNRTNLRNIATASARMSEAARPPHHTATVAVMESSLSVGTITQSPPRLVVVTTGSTQVEVMTSVPLNVSQKRSGKTGRATSSDNIQEADAGTQPFSPSSSNTPATTEATPQVATNTNTKRKKTTPATSVTSRKGKEPSTPAALVSGGAGQHNTSGDKLRWMSPEHMDEAKPQGKRPKNK